MENEFIEQLESAQSPNNRGRMVCIKTFRNDRRQIPGELVQGRTAAAEGRFELRGRFGA
jgi:hypothetical protein